MNRHYVPASACRAGATYTGPLVTDGALAFVVLSALDPNPYDRHIPKAYRLAARILLRKPRRLRYSR